MSENDTVDYLLPATLDRLERHIEECERAGKHFALIPLHWARSMVAELREVRKADDRFGEWLRRAVEEGKEQDSERATE